MDETRPTRTQSRSPNDQPKDGRPDDRAAQRRPESDRPPVKPGAPGREEQRDDRGREKENPDAIGRMEEEGREEELPKDLPKVPTLRIVIIVAVLVVLLIGLFLAGYIPHRRQVARLEQKSKAVQDAKPAVEILQARRSGGDFRLQLPGNAIPLQQTSIYPRANGYLKKLYADIGDHVRAGELLAEIDTPEIDAQYAAAKANITQADANLLRAQKDHDLAEVTLQRYQGFFKDGGVTQQQLDQTKNGFNQAASALKGASAALESARAEEKRLSALVGFEKIFAPFDGVVAVRNFDVGALFNPSNTTPAQQIFEIDRTDILRVFVNVPQVYATEIQLGHAATFSVRNYTGHPFSGTVTRTAGAIDPRTRTLRMQIDFPNTDGKLLSGMYGQVTIEAPRQTPQLIVPTSALIFNAEGLRVAVVDGQHKIHFKTIVVGRDFGTEVEVLDGLTGDEQIVANPGERLAENVEVTTSPAPQDAKAAQSGGRNAQDAPGSPDKNKSGQTGKGAQSP
jgi:RND family efflux transporter MFP subunit